MVRTDTFDFVKGISNSSQVQFPYLCGPSSFQARSEESSGHIHTRTQCVSEPRQCFQGFTNRRRPFPTQSDHFSDQATSWASYRPHEPFISLQDGYLAHQAPSAYQVHYPQRPLPSGTRQHTLNPLAPDFIPSQREQFSTTSALNSSSAVRRWLPEQADRMHAQPFSNFASFATLTAHVPVAHEIGSDKAMPGRGRPWPFIFTAQEDFDAEAHYYAVNRSNFQLVSEVVFRWPRDSDQGASQPEYPVAPVPAPIKVSEAFGLADSHSVRHPPQAPEADAATRSPENISSVDVQTLPSCETVQGLRIVQVLSVRSLVFTVQDESYAEIQFNAAATTAAMDLQGTDGFAERPAIDSARLAWLSIAGTGYLEANDINRRLPLSFPPLRDRTSSSTDSSTSTSATVNSYSTAATSIYNLEGPNEESGQHEDAALDTDCPPCSDAAEQAEDHVPSSPSEGSRSEDSHAITHEALEQRLDNLHILGLPSANITLRPPRTRDRQLSPTSEQRMRHEIQQARLRLDAFEAGAEAASSLTADTRGLEAIREEDELAESEGVRGPAEVLDTENNAKAGPVVIGGLERIEEETVYQATENAQALALEELDEFQDAAGADEAEPLEEHPPVTEVTEITEHPISQRDAEGYDSGIEIELGTASGEPGVAEAIEPQLALPSPAPTNLSIATTMLPPPSPATLVDEPLRHVHDRQARPSEQAMPIIPPRVSSVLRPTSQIPPRVHPLDLEGLQTPRDSRRSANPQERPLIWAPRPSGPFPFPLLNLAPLPPHLTAASPVGGIAELPPRAPGHTETRTVPIPRLTLCEDESGYPIHPRGLVRSPDILAQNGQTFEEAAEEYMTSQNPPPQQHCQTRLAQGVRFAQQARRVPSNGDISNVAIVGSHVNRQHSAPTEHSITDRLPTAHAPGPRSCLRSNRRVFAGAHINGHPPVDIASALAAATSIQNPKDPHIERPISRRVRFTIPSSPTVAAMTASTVSPSSSMETLRRCLAERDVLARGDPQSQRQESLVARLDCTTHDDETIQPVPELPTFTSLRPRHDLGLSGLSGLQKKTKKKKKLLTKGRATKDESRNGDRDGDRNEYEHSMQPLLPTGTAALQSVSVISTAGLDSLMEKAKGLLKKSADKVRGLFGRRNELKGPDLLDGLAFGT